MPVRLASTRVLEFQRLSSPFSGERHAVFFQEGVEAAWAALCAAKVQTIGNPPIRGRSRPVKACKANRRYRTQLPFWEFMRTFADARGVRPTGSVRATVGAGAAAIPQVAESEPPSKIEHILTSIESAAH